MSIIEAAQVSRDDRRQWSRASVRLPLCIVDTEGGFGVLTGEAVDLSVGGLRALVDGTLGGAMETTVRLDLIDGPALLCEALVAGGGAVDGTVDGAWEYRLAFRNLSAEETLALERLVADQDGTDRADRTGPT